MAINNALERRLFERRFFLAVAILFPLTIFIGFGPTYYVKEFFPTPALPSRLLHIHGALMTSWVLLFIAQVYLISSKRIRIHQKLGLASIALAALIIVVGTLTGIEEAQREIRDPNLQRLSSLVIPLGDLLTFAVLFAAALYYRKKASDHKRLIILTILSLLPPALARFPFGLSDAFGPLWYFGTPDLLAIGFVVFDAWQNKKVNRAFLVGAAFMIALHWLRFPLSTTAIWLNFASWLTGIPV